MSDMDNYLPERRKDQKTHPVTVRMRPDTRERMLALTDEFRVTSTALIDGMINRLYDETFPTKGKAK